jgi:hypothetical protein
MWTGPIEVTIDEMCVVVGPNLDSYMSHDDSYINESDEDLRVRVMEPYDPSNMFNIFENQLKLKPKNKDQQASKTKNWLSFLCRRWDKKLRLAV